MRQYSVEVSLSYIFYLTPNLNSSAFPIIYISSVISTEKKNKPCPPWNLLALKLNNLIYIFNAQSEIIVENFSNILRFNQLVGLMTIPNYQFSGRWFFVVTSFLSAIEYDL